MTKSEAMAIFGGSPEALAAALGCAYSTVKQWPEELPQPQTDRVVGAAHRLGVLHRLPGGDGEMSAPRALFA